MLEKSGLTPIAERIKELFGPIDKLKDDSFGRHPKYVIDEDSFDEKIGYFKLKSLQRPHEDLEYLLLDREHKIVAHRVRTKLEGDREFPTRTMIEYTDGVVVGRYEVNYDGNLPQSIIVALSPILKEELIPIDRHAAAAIFLDNKVSTVGIGYGDSVEGWEREAIFQIKDGQILFEYGSARAKVETGVSFFPDDTKPYGYQVTKNSDFLDITRIDTRNIRNNWYLSVQKMQNLQVLDRQMRGSITEWPQAYKILQMQLLMGTQLALP